MIYVVTNDISKFKESPIYKFASVENFTKYLLKQEELAVDTETRGFDPHTKALISLQVGDYNNQFVVDCETVDIFQFKEILESKVLIMHNGKFDLKFFYKKGIYPTKVFDTFVAEKILNCGLNMIKAALDAVATRYLNVVLDKSLRANITREGLTPRMIGYGADDVKYLHLIKEAQLKKAQEQDLIRVIKLENMFTPALAYIEFCGFKLDAAKWKEKMTKDQATLDAHIEKLNDWIIAKGEDKYIEQQLDFFREQRCSVNWASPKQVATFMMEQGVDCTVEDKKAGKTKLSVEESVIKKYSDTHEIVKFYLDYKHAEKVISTYGESFLNQINPVTGRIHTNFKQILDTGRISSGGKDKSTGEAYVNFQNIPADPETRSCFVAEEGNTLIICDYSGQEQVILANYCLDENLLKFYDEGFGDMHSYNASLMFPELNGVPLEEIKKNHKDKRGFAKTAGFAINYGGAGSTIAADLNISVEEGDKIYNAYFEAFPGLRDYFKKVHEQGTRDGYIYISEITGRKSYLYGFERFKVLESMMDRAFWTRYRELKKYGGLEYESMKKNVKDYFSMKGEIERKCQNFPIQGRSAEVTKLSCIYIYEYLVKNNLLGVVKFVNTVHDENVLECPIHMAKEIGNMVGDAMVRAGKFFCKRVPLKADPDYSLFWRK